MSKKQSRPKAARTLSPKIEGGSVIEYSSIKVSNLPKFDAADHLDSEETIAAYLADIREANDSALLASALEDIARARTRLAGKQKAHPEG